MNDNLTIKNITEAEQEIVIWVLSAMESGLLMIEGEGKPTGTIAEIISIYNIDESDFMSTLKARIKMINEVRSNLELITIFDTFDLSLYAHTLYTLYHSESITSKVRSSLSRIIKQADNCQVYWKLIKSKKNGKKRCEFSD